MIHTTAVRRIAGGAISIAVLLGTLIFTSSPAAASFPTYEDIYLRNANSAKCLEVEDSSSANGARVQQWSCFGQPGAYWYFRPVLTDSDNTTWYNIVNSNSGKVLEIEDSAWWDGARAQQWDWVGQQGALWAAFRQYDNTHRLVNRASWKTLEIADSRVDNGAPAQQWAYDRGYACKLFY